jgi:hypothetical protein
MHADIGIRPSGDDPLEKGAQVGLWVPESRASALTAWVTIRIASNMKIAPISGVESTRPYTVRILSGATRKRESQTRVKHFTANISLNVASEPGGCRDCAIGVHNY